MRFLFSAMLLLCTSCIHIGSDPQPMHYYLLDSITETKDRYSGKALDIDLELSFFPDYLDRPQVVTRSRKNAVRIADNERWAEPLRDNLMQVLRENLILLMPEASVTVSPWEISDPASVRVKLMINKFSGDIGGFTDVDVRWAIGKDSDGMTRGHFTDQQPVGNSYRDLVIGLNNGIGALSRELAEKLTEID